MAIFKELDFQGHLGKTLSAFNLGKVAQAAGLPPNKDKKDQRQLKSKKGKSIYLRPRGQMALNFKRKSPTSNDQSLDVSRGHPGCSSAPAGCGGHGDLVIVLD